jgi:hypothetical protein
VSFGQKFSKFFFKVPVGPWWGFEQAKWQLGFGLFAGKIGELPPAPPN